MDKHSTIVAFLLEDDEDFNLKEVEPDPSAPDPYEAWLAKFQRPQNAADLGFRYRRYEMGTDWANLERKEKIVLLRDYAKLYGLETEAEAAVDAVDKWNNDFRQF